MATVMALILKMKILILFLSTGLCLSRYGAQCRSECHTLGQKYYWCWTDQLSGMSWDYCSPQRGLTYRGDMCSTEHACNKYGFDYYWCYTQSGRWDYCSNPGSERN